MHIRDFSGLMQRCLATPMHAAAVLALGALAASCATQPPPGANAPMAVEAPIRKPPHFKMEHVNYDMYPAKAKRLGLSGRVLVEFHIDPDGGAAGVKVVRSDADPVLQPAAVQTVEHLKFDVTDPGFDAANPAPFLLQVSYCMAPCEKPPQPYAADIEELKVTGSTPRPLYATPH